MSHDTNPTPSPTTPGTDDVSDLDTIDNPATTQQAFDATLDHPRTATTPGTDAAFGNDNPAGGNPVVAVRATIPDDQRTPDLCGRVR